MCTWLMAGVRDLMYWLGLGLSKEEFLNYANFLFRRFPDSKEC